MGNPLPSLLVVGYLLFIVLVVAMEDESLAGKYLRRVLLTNNAIGIMFTAIAAVSQNVYAVFATAVLAIVLSDLLRTRRERQMAKPADIRAEIRKLTVTGTEQEGVEPSLRSHIMAHIVVRNHGGGETGAWDWQMYWGSPANRRPIKKIEKHEVALCRLYEEVPNAEGKIVRTPHTNGERFIDHVTDRNITGANRPSGIFVGRILDKMSPHDLETIHMEFWYLKSGNEYREYSKPVGKAIQFGLVNVELVKS